MFLHAVTHVVTHLGLAPPGCGKITFSWESMVRALDHWRCACLVPDCSVIQCMCAVQYKISSELIHLIQLHLCMYSDTVCIYHNDILATCKSRARNWQVINSRKSGVANTKKKRYRGYGWSSKGSKAYRRQQRQTTVNKWFYAVAVGYRPGIYDTWADAKKQVFGYRGAVHQKFKELQKAFDFLQKYRCIPPSRRQLWSEAEHIPHPPRNYYEAERRYHAVSDCVVSDGIKDLEETETNHPHHIPTHVQATLAITQPASRTHDEFYRYHTASYRAEVNIIDLTDTGADTERLAEAKIVLESGS